VEVHGVHPVDLKDRKDIEVAAKFYPVELELPLTAELVARMMGHVRRQLTLSFIPLTCETFCKSSKVWEMKTNVNYRPE
jgi:hypothetical protein